MKKIILFSVLMLMFVCLVSSVMATVPTVSDVAITTAGGFPHLDSEDLEATSTEYDADGDYVKSIHRWIKDNNDLLELIMPFEMVDGTVNDNAKDYSTNSYDGTPDVASHFWCTGGLADCSGGGYDGLGNYGFSLDDLEITFEGGYWDPDTDPTWTVEAWMRSDGGGNRDTVVIGGGQAEGKIGCEAWGIIFGDGSHSDHAMAYFGDSTLGCSSNLDVELEGTTDVGDGNWHHIAFVRAGASNWKLYVDGDLEDSYFPLAVTYESYTNMVIGGKLNGELFDYFDGQIDDVRIWNIALTEAQIELLADGDSDNRDVDDDFFDSSLTSIGDEFDVCITPNDNNSDGTEVCTSSSVEIDGDITGCKSTGWVEGETYFLTGNVPVSGNDDGDCMVITENDVTLDCDGYTIDGDDDDNGYGVSLSSSVNGLTIDNCVIQEFEEGVHLDNNDNVVIDDSTIQNNKDYGVYGINSDNVNIFESDGSAVITGHADDSGDAGIYINTGCDGWEIGGSAADGISITSNAIGIELVGDADSNTFDNNDLDDNDYGIYIASASADNNIFTTNTITNSGTMGIYFGADDALDQTFTSNTIAGQNYYHCNGLTSWSAPTGTLASGAYTNYGAINIYDCDGSGEDAISVDSVTISGNTVAGSDGIYMIDSSNVEVDSSTVSNANDDGIVLDNSPNVDIEDTTVSSNGGDGVLLMSGSDSVEFTLASSISSNTDDGIEMSSVGSIVVDSCTVSSNGDNGIEMSSVTSATIDDTTISGNTGHGVYGTNSDDVNIYSSSGAHTAHISGHDGSGDAGIYIDTGCDGWEIGGSAAEAVLIDDNYYGVYYASSASTANSITYNTIESNSQAGIAIDSAADNVDIYENDFNTDGDQNTHASCSGTPSNIDFDSGSAGNHWDDYDEISATENCQDENLNNKCDIPNVILATYCLDNHPYQDVEHANCDALLTTCTTNGNGECGSNWCANSRYCLANDIHDYPSDCMVIDANSVTLNCKGFDADADLIDGDDVGSDNGIDIGSQDNTVVKNCVITDFTDGVVLTTSADSNEIFDNIFSSQAGEAINLYYSTNTVIYGNTFDGCSQGIYNNRATGTVIRKNVFGETTGNTYGVSLVGTGGIGNSVYHNDFYSSPVRDTIGGNDWDNGTGGLPDNGGNYWDGWSCPGDATGGICDDIYSITTSGTDNYPLEIAYN